MKHRSRGRFCGLGSVAGVGIGATASDCRGRNFHEVNPGLEGLNSRTHISLKSRMPGGNKHFGKDQTRHFMFRHCFSFEEPSLMYLLGFTLTLFTLQSPYFMLLNLPLTLF